MNEIPSWVNPQTVPGYVGTAKTEDVLNFVEKYLHDNCTTADEYNELLKAYGLLRQEVGELRAENEMLRQQVKTKDEKIVESTNLYHNEMRRKMKLERELEYMKRKAGK